MWLIKIWWAVFSWLQVQRLRFRLRDLLLHACTLHYRGILEVCRHPYADIHQYGFISYKLLIPDWQQNHWDLDHRATWPSSSPNHSVTLSALSHRSSTLPNRRTTAIRGSRHELCFLLPHLSCLSLSRMYSFQHTCHKAWRVNAMRQGVKVLLRKPRFHNRLEHFSQTNNVS